MPNGVTFGGGLGGLGGVNLGDPRLTLPAQQAPGLSGFNPGIQVPVPGTPGLGGTLGGLGALPPPGAGFNVGDPSLDVGGAPLLSLEELIGEDSAKKKKKKKKLDFTQAAALSGSLGELGGGLGRSIDDIIKLF